MLKNTNFKNSLFAIFILINLNLFNPPFAEAQNNKNGVAIYLLNKSESIPSSTKGYWKKINFSTRSITSCKHKQTNFNNCVSSQVERIIKDYSYPYFVVLITDIEITHAVDFISSTEFSSRLSLFISFRPGEINEQTIKSSKNAIPSILLVGTNDNKSIIRNSISTANKLRESGFNIWTSWLTPYSHANKKRVDILSPQVVFLTANVFNLLENKYQEFLAAERLWQYPPIEEPNYYAQGKYANVFPVDKNLLNILK